MRPLQDVELEDLTEHGAVLLGNEHPAVYEKFAGRVMIGRFFWHQNGRTKVVDGKTIRLPVSCAPWIRDRLNYAHRFGMRFVARTWAETKGRPPDPNGLIGGGR